MEKTFFLSRNLLEINYFKLSFYHNSDVQKVLFRLSTLILKYPHDIGIFLSEFYSRIHRWMELAVKLI